MYELIVIWNSGEKDIFKYSTLERAAQTERGYKKAFGNQIQWTGIIRAVIV